MSNDWQNVHNSRSNWIKIIHLLIGCHDWLLQESDGWWISRIPYNLSSPSSSVTTERDGKKGNKNCPRPVAYRCRIVVLFLIGTRWIIHRDLFLHKFDIRVDRSRLSWQRKGEEAGKVTYVIWQRRTASPRDDAILRYLREPCSRRIRNVDLWNIECFLVVELGDKNRSWKWKLVGNLWQWKNRMEKTEYKEFVCFKSAWIV